MTDHILRDLKDHILTIRINRPDRKNALTADMYASMAQAIEDAEADHSVRAVVIIGTEGCFTAGNDLNDFLQNPPKDESSPTFRFIRALVHATVPIIAAVDGPAVGIGTTLLLHCDLVYVTSSAKLLMPFVNLGLVPENAASYLLPRMLGHTKASELILMGAPVSGTQAVELGLANLLCETGELEQTAQAAAAQLAEKPPAAVRASKKLLRSYLGDMEEVVKAEIVAFSAALDSAEAKEAMTAFFEKRKPDFSKLA